VFGKFWIWVERENMPKRQQSPGRHED